MAGGALLAMGGPPSLGAILAAPGWVGASTDRRHRRRRRGPPAGEHLARAAFGLDRRPDKRGHRWRDVARAPPTTAAHRARDTGRGRPSAISTRVALDAGSRGDLVVAVTVTGAVIVSRSSGEARVTVLDVGQGDAILVEGSKGGRLLIDGGPDPDRLLVELDRRLPPWDRRIDALILSHPHEDHVAGLALLLDRYAVARVFEPGMRGPGPGYAAWLDRVASAGQRRDSRSPPATAWPSMRSTCASSGRSKARCRSSPRTRAPPSTTSRSWCSGPSVGGDSCSPVMSSRRSTRACSPRACPPSTCSRSPITAAGRRRPRLSSRRSDRGSRSPRPVPATRTDTQPDRPSSALGPPARVYRTDQDGTVSVTFDAAGMSVRTSPRRQAAASVSRARASASARVVASRRALLCDVPRQPFVPDVGTAPARPSRGWIGPRLPSGR